MRDVDERMNGGAVSDERSPLNDAIDLRKAVQELLFWAAMPEVSESVVDITWRVGKGKARRYED